MEQLTGTEYNRLSIWERRVMWVNDLITRCGEQVQERNAPPVFKLEAAKAVLYLYDIGVQVDPMYTKIGDKINYAVFGETGCCCFSADMFTWAKQAKADGSFMSGDTRFPDLA